MFYIGVQSHMCSVSHLATATASSNFPFSRTLSTPTFFSAPSSAAMKTTAIPRGSGRLGGESGTLAFGLCGDSAAETNSGAWWGLNSNLAQCFVFVLPSAKFASIKCHQCHQSMSCYDMADFWLTWLASCILTALEAASLELRLGSPKFSQEARQKSHMA